MERRSCSPMMVTILLALLCLSVWQLIGCPGPPTQIYVSPIYNLLPPINYTEQNPMDSLPPWDFSTLINLDDFKLNILNTVCNDSNPSLIILVHSAPNHQIKRNTIRNTWGAERDNLKLVFLLGKVENQTMQQHLEEENKLHGDLIQGNFKDAYRNMTYKLVMALKYVVYYCPQAKFIMKTDDDAFVNIPFLMDLLKENSSPLSPEKLLLCKISENAIAKRSYRSKWRVSPKEWPHKYYPNYCAGFAVLFSPDIVLKLYREAQRSEYFWIDDVHITGIIAQRLKIEHTSINKLVLSDREMRRLKKTNGADIKSDFLFGPPNLLDEDIYLLWNFLRADKMSNLIENR